ncbi:MAG TPA: hypothetical protein VIH76_19900 [Candidatus Acidoferrales bacterium]
MTIGIGYAAREWILLCSDMELTSGFAKFKGIKDYFTWFDNQKGVIACVFSDKPDDMHCVWEQVELGIADREKNGSSLTIVDVRTILTQSLKTVFINRRSKFQMLVAISKTGEESQFLRVWNTQVSPVSVGGWEAIGGGDVELTRYLISLMYHQHLSEYQAACWASHMVDIASKFVQGVGQGIRLSLVSNGHIQYMMGEVYSKKMRVVDSYVAGLWFDFCNVDRLTEDEFKTRVKNFADATLVVRGTIPKILISGG